MLISLLITVERVHFCTEKCKRNWRNCRLSFNIFIIEAILIWRGGCRPLGHAYPCHPLKQYRQAWRNDFQSFQSRNIGINAQKTPQKFDVKEVAFKKYRKNLFHTVIYLKIPFYLYQPTFGCDEFFFPFSSKILYACFLNGSTPKKNCIKCAIAKYEHCKQSLRCTNNANKIREISSKKFWLLSWTPKRFWQIDAPVRGTIKAFTNRLSSFIPRQYS